MYPGYTRPKISFPELHCTCISERSSLGEIPLFELLPYQQIKVLVKFRINKLLKYFCFPWYSSLFRVLFILVIVWEVPSPTLPPSSELSLCFQNELLMPVSMIEWKQTPLAFPVPWPEFPAPRRSAPRTARSGCESSFKIQSHLCAGGYHSHH